MLKVTWKEEDADNCESVSKIAGGPNMNLIDFSIYASVVWLTKTIIFGYCSFVKSKISGPD